MDLMSLQRMTTFQPHSFVLIHIFPAKEKTWAISSLLGSDFVSIPEVKLWFKQVDWYDVNILQIQFERKHYFQSMYLVHK